MPWNRNSFKGDEERVRIKGSCEYNLLDKHIAGSDKPTLDKYLWFHIVFSLDQRQYISSSFYPAYPHSHTHTHTHTENLVGSVKAENSCICTRAAKRPSGSAFSSLAAYAYVNNKLCVVRARTNCIQLIALSFRIQASYYGMCSPFLYQDIAVLNAWEAEDLESTSAVCV